ncbi:MAG: type VII toxin-antitoxin system HepT family RNase toxin [Candidatus Hodarchaeales archaeon]|jgi:uncharacterized protein YutE (UPF0331/DUF86 family)
MAIDNDIIFRRLHLIKNCVEKINQILGRGIETYLEDEILELALERCLQISAQSIADIGSHIIAQKGWSIPETYSQILSVLGKKDVIEKQLAKKLAEFMGLRNILVHAYLDIESERLFSEVKININNLTEFIKEIKEYIDKKK